jgi:hypothetical protein
MSKSKESRKFEDISEEGHETPHSQENKGKMDFKHPGKSPLGSDGAKVFFPRSPLED